MAEPEDKPKQPDSAPPAATAPETPAVSRFTRLESPAGQGWNVDGHVFASGGYDGAMHEIHAASGLRDDPLQRQFVLTPPGATASLRVGGEIVGQHVSTTGNTLTLDAHASVTEGFGTAGDSAFHLHRGDTAIGMKEGERFHGLEAGAGLHIENPSGIGNIGFYARVEGGQMERTAQQSQETGTMRLAGSRSSPGPQTSVLVGTAYQTPGIALSDDLDLSLRTGAQVGRTLSGHAEAVLESGKVQAYLGSSYMFGEMPAAIAGVQAEIAPRTTVEAQLQFDPLLPRLTHHTIGVEETLRVDVNHRLSDNLNLGATGSLTESTQRATVSAQYLSGGDGAQFMAGLEAGIMATETRTRSGPDVTPAALRVGPISSVQENTTVAPVVQATLGIKF